MWFDRDHDGLVRVRVRVRVRAGVRARARVRSRVRVGGRVEVGRPQRTMPTPSAARMAPMLSTATLESATTSTGVRPMTRT